MRAFRFRIRTFLVAVAILTVLMKWVVVPAWDYYSLPTSTRSVLAKLGRPLRMATPAAPSLADLLKSAKLSSMDGGDAGIPIYIDPTGLSSSGSGLDASVQVPTGGPTVGRGLEESLRPLGLGYYVEDGLLRITSAWEADRALRDRPRGARRP